MAAQKVATAAMMGPQAADPKEPPTAVEAGHRDGSMHEVCLWVAWPLLKAFQHRGRGLLTSHLIALFHHGWQKKGLHDTLLALAADLMTSFSQKQPAVTLGSPSLQEVRASTEESAAAVVAEDNVASLAASVPETAEQAASVPWTLAGELPLIAIHLHASDASSVTVAAFAKSLNCRSVPSSNLTSILLVAHIRICGAYCTFIPVHWLCASLACLKHKLVSTGVVSETCVKYV